MRLWIVGLPESNDVLAPRLHAAGFAVETFADPDTAREAIRRRGLPHLLIVHVEMCDDGGIRLCEEVRALADLPVIILAHDDVPGQAARALRYADDYVRMPVDPQELVMRIRRILSRITDYSYASGSRVRVCDRLTVDYVQRCVVVDGRERQLTPTENLLLHVLLKHRGSVVETDTLIARVWHAGAALEDRNALRVHMHRLRHKLESDPANPSFIQTERGIGYVFTGC